VCVEADLERRSRDGDADGWLLLLLLLWWRWWWWLYLSLCLSLAQFLKCCSSQCLGAVAGDDVGREEELEWWSRHREAEAEAAGNSWPGGGVKVLLAGQLLLELLVMSSAKRGLAGGGGLGVASMPAAWRVLGEWSRELSKGVAISFSNGGSEREGRGMRNRLGGRHVFRRLNE
jgi:hypothetical protein